MCYTFRQGFMEVAGGQFVSSVTVPVEAWPRLEKREVIEGPMEVLEVVNSYLAIPVTTFSVKKMEQVEHLLRVLPNYQIVCLRLTLIQMKVWKVAMCSQNQTVCVHLSSRNNRGRRLSTSVQMMKKRHGHTVWW